MRGLLIGEVARQAGLSTSALRFYEKSGLLPAPARVSRRRQYDPAVFGRIRIILLARDSGFTLSETRTFLNGFPGGTTPAARWRAMAEKKLVELDSLMSRVARMKLLLEASFRCECRRIEDCERIAASTRSRTAGSAAPRTLASAAFRTTAARKLRSPS